MKLSQRLAFRPPPRRKSAPRAASEAGFGHRRFRYPVETPLGVAGDAPPGFELLCLPAAAPTAQSIGPLGGATVDAACGRPAIAFDLETSGLDPIHSIPYIACAAWHEDDALVIEQWTLTEARAERSFLAAFIARLTEVTEPDTHLVSFNGRCFDIPRLQVRLTRLGVDPEALDCAHVDLVGPARRLYRGLHQDCRLTTLERRVLDVHRRGDLSGAEVAGVWDQLQSHPSDPWVRNELELAQVHNRADLLSLFALMRSMRDAIEAPADAAAAVRAARHWLGLENVERARAVLEPWSASLCASPQPDESTLEGLLVLADLRRRDAAFDEAATCWRRVCGISPGHPAAHEALAKHLEHRTRCPQAALEVASASGDPCPRRIARLQAKVAKGGELRASPGSM